MNIKTRGRVKIKVINSVPHILVDGKAKSKTCSINKAKNIAQTYRRLLKNGERFNW